MENKKKFDPGKIISDNVAWFVLLILVIFFGIFSENFFSFRNIMNLLSQNAYLLIAATGITFVMMSSGMDLSVGYVMSTIGIIGAKLLMDAGLPTVLVILVMIALTIAIELLNTFLSIKLNLSLLVVTIATMTIFQGATYIISESKTITNLPDSFKFLGQKYLFHSIPIAVIIMVVLFLIMSFVLNKTYFGRYVYALGGNPEAARLAGININKMRYMIAVIEGLFIGIAVVLLIGRLGSAVSTVGVGTEFSVMTGIFLGGVSIRGGEGKLSGVFAGILCIALLTNGMQLAGINIYYQYVVRGLILLAAIGYDVYQLNRRNNMKKKKLEEAREAKRS
ncbi:MAG: ABC transporter permease [Lachnospiraceae bacterium]|nr:ABC transporter permease [Lachnospiraceae bacterium]